MPHFGCCFSGQFAQSGQLGFALNNTDDATFMAGAHDGVRLPVAEPTFASHDLWSFLDADAIGNLTPANISAITFALLLLAAQMLMQSATAPFLCIDVEIDAFMADGWLLLKL